MNFKRLTVLAAAISVGLMATPAQAAFLGTDTVDTTTTDIKDISTKPFPFVSSTFSFGADTQVNFTVVFSKGMNQNHVGFWEGNTFTSLFTESQGSDPGSSNANDWLGTCPTSIQPCSKSVIFKAGKTYKLGLSTDIVGQDSFAVSDQGQFQYSVKSDQQNPEVFNTVSDPNAWFIGFEDGGFKAKGDGNFYYDYQDWIIKATVPEPTMLVGLGAMAGLLAASRRRKAERA
ncbi:hypothetical protein BST81_17600 [Leptolyngbya sp. 'hensonii']|uniref:PEP-CTERM sorting domain-containing protein n=1 Tax=Leptolyngbya sp. 'hensonii' TaxID=1922337 RepID=UPI000950105E|nr:PEP-CTERM sorting domain-containing protein [Leptolyngbya sp. 'hensonii']OLP17165.1 hypothetical protein BST81_17600 [Leptolyngbya sp. 'hensonii']